MNIVRIFALCLIDTVTTKTIDHNLEDESILKVTLQGRRIRSASEGKSDDRLLTNRWQDYVLGNAVLANHLNILVIHASRSDFPLVNTSYQCTSYVKSPNSFRQTISQLANNIGHVLINIYKDFNRIQISLERIPVHLKTILLLIRKGTKTTIQTKLPDLLRKNEIIVNESLTILQQPITKIEQVKNLLDELYSLIPMVTSDNVIPLQVEDVKTQWMLLTDLFRQLAIEAEKSSNYFLLQFNWILEQFISLDIDNNRDLIINLIKSKVIEIDRITDLLTIISQTYVDISLEYSNEKLSSNTQLIFLSNEQERKESIKQSRYELQPQAVKIARLALKRHDEFLRRNQNRHLAYENFLTEMSQNDLNILLSIN